jgi:hypothetical protein
MLSGLVPPHELKREVFDKFAKVRNTAFAFKAFAVFQVSEIRQHLRPQIVTFMNKDVDYKRAAEIIIFFNLQSEFSLVCFILEMIFCICNYKMELNLAGGDRYSHDTD